MFNVPKYRGRLQFTRPEFVPCPECAKLTGTAPLCRECLERRELHYTFVRPHMICQHCQGTPNPECPRHGR